jgi:hypothetical protein
MLRRLIGCGLIVGMTMLASTGCDELHKSVRKKSDGTGPEAVDSDGKKILGVDSDDKDQQPFFKNNRKTGGWSSEAREIENSLGVN